MNNEQYEQTFSFFLFPFQSRSSCLENDFYFCYDCDCDYGSYFCFQKLLVVLD